MKRFKILLAMLALSFGSSAWADYDPYSGLDNTIKLYLYNCTSDASCPGIPQNKIPSPFSSFTAEVGVSIKTLFLDSQLPGFSSFGIYDATQDPQSQDLRKLALFSSQPKRGDSTVFSMLDGFTFKNEATGATQKFASNAYGFYLNLPTGSYYSSVGAFFGRKGDGSTNITPPGGSTSLWGSSTYVLGFACECEYFHWLITPNSNVPTPGSLGLLGLGLVGFGLFRLRLRGREIVFTR
jgi:hypothetical protein